MAAHTCDILFAIMAVREVTFFVPVARKLIKNDGLNVAFLTFHEAGDSILEKEGIPYFSFHKIKRDLNAKGKHEGSLKKDIAELMGTDIEHLILHERLTSNRGRECLMSKADNYFSIINDIFVSNNIRCVIQELGGFIAPLTLYYVSRLHNVDHVFIEPAMFKKRIVFTLNELYADIRDYGSVNVPVTDDLKDLLSDYMTQKTVAIPKKDRHFFKDMTFKRLFSADNFGRLSRKLYHKYILGLDEEFNWISWYAYYHLMKAVRRKIMVFYYTKPAEGEKYIYYPFHVPVDVQLTARCPAFLDQESLVAKIADCLPHDYKLYIKEHPAAIGGHSLSKLGAILRSRNNIRLLHPAYNSYDIIKKAACVITVNSKVGFEAIIQGKPVIVLGKTFYRGKDLTLDVKSIHEIAEKIRSAISDYRVTESQKEFFLAQVFNWTYKGELYDNSPENLDAFYSSLKVFFSKYGIVPLQQYINPNELNTKPLDVTNSA